MSDNTNKLDSRMKIGARILNDISMKVLLPNYENIFNQISEIRENAISLKDTISRDDEYREILTKEPEFAKHHNNVFSILGERGSGKTSVQLTLKYFIMECLQKKYNRTDQVKDEIRIAVEKSIKKNDTVLPIIVPQDMDADSNSMGWIIGFFNEIAKKIEKEYQNNRSLFKYRDDKCYAYGSENKNKFINYITQSLEKVRRAYFLRQKQYKKLLTDISSKKEYVDENSEILMKDIDLVKAFKEFIDEYVGLKRSQNNGEEPLIYIFFDDVDISTKKCIDVLETIMRFLSHSNIVVFVAGNNKTFKETIVIDYLKDEGLLYKDLMNSSFEEEEKTALETRKILAYDYLKKVLSPALRYEMQVLSDNEKVEFKYNAVNKLDETYKTLYELIVECFGLEEDNFLVFNGEDKLTPYFMIFDNKPRGLMNVYYYLNGKAQRLKELKKDVNEDKYKGIIRDFWTASELERLLDLIIESSSELNIYREIIKRVIGIEDEEIKINVNLEELEREDILKRKELKLTIIMLAFFIKGIMNEKIISKQTKKITSDILYENTKFTNLDKEKIEIKNKDNFFFETENIEKNIKVFLLLKKNINNIILTEKELLYIYLKAIFLIEENETEGFIEYLEKFYYEEKNKIKMILKKIYELKDKKNIELRRELTKYFEFFYLYKETNDYLNKIYTNLTLEEFSGLLNNKESYILDAIILSKSLLCDKESYNEIQMLENEEFIPFEDKINTLDEIRDLLEDHEELEISFLKGRILDFEKHKKNKDQHIYDFFTIKEVNIFTSIYEILGEYANLEGKLSEESEIQIESKFNEIKNYIFLFEKNKFLDLINLLNEYRNENSGLEIFDLEKNLLTDEISIISKELEKIKFKAIIDNNTEQMREEIFVIKDNVDMLECFEKLKTLEDDKIKNMSILEVNILFHELYIVLIKKRIFKLFSEEIENEKIYKFTKFLIDRENKSEKKEIENEIYDKFIKILIDKVIELEEEIVQNDILIEIESNDKKITFENKIRCNIYIEIFHSLHSLKYENRNDLKIAKDDRLIKIYDVIKNSIKLKRLLPLEAK